MCHLSKGITESQQLHSAAQTVTILSIRDVELFLLHKKGIGKVDSRMVYFCRNIPITLSTCMRTLESLQEDSTSMALSCFLPFVKAGSFTSAQ